MIIYDRETDRLWQSSYFVNDQGLSVSTTVNSGHKTDRGAQLDVSTPLLAQVKGMASINLFDSRVPVDPLLRDERLRTFRYSGNATVERRGHNRGQIPGDTAQAQLVYLAPGASTSFAMTKSIHATCLGRTASTASGR